MKFLKQASAWWLALPSLAAVAVYWPVLQFGYVWDDIYILVGRPEFRSWATLFEAILHPFLTSQAYFRPLPLLMLGMEQLIGGGNPWLSHLDALLLHAVNAALVAILGAVVCDRHGWPAPAAIRGGVLAGLIYGLHPALVETVSWISVRFDVLVTLFALLGLLADRAIASTAVRAVAVASMFLLAALCKEMALSWALSLPLWHLMFTARPASWRGYPAAYRAGGHLAVYAAVGFAAVVYFVLRTQYLGRSLPGMDGLLLSPADHVLYVFKSLGKYLVLGFWPFTTAGPLHFLTLPLRAADPEVWLGAAAALAFLTLTVFAIAREGSGYRALPAAFLVTLLPVINIVPLQMGDNYAQDRFLTLPLVYLAIWGALCAMALFRPHARQRLRILIGGLLLTFWVGFSLLNVRVTAPFWRNELSLWVFAHLRDPASVSGGVNLMYAYANIGRLDAAEKVGQEIRATQPAGPTPDVRIAYANILERQDRLEAARDELLEALPIVGDGSYGGYWRYKANLQLGLVYARMGELDLAIPVLEQAAASRPADTEPAYRLATVLIAAGQRERGERLLQQVFASMHASVREEFRADVDVSIGEFTKASAARKRAGAAP